jgi:hypothetical protein
MARAMRACGERDQKAMLAHPRIEAQAHANAAILAEICGAPRAMGE